MLSPNADDDASGPVRWRRERRPSALLLAWITFLLQNRQAASLEPVRLQPLHFLRSVAAGDNVQTMCAVQSGDEVDFSWRKDGQPLSAIGHRLVIHSLPTTSILLIKNATVFDAGNYTCVGRNALGHDSVTAQLRVEDSVEVPPGPRWQGFSDSSIELSSVSRQDVGTYRCRADNGLGQVSADIELVVRGLPADRKLFLAGAVKKEVKGTTLGFCRRPTALRLTLALHWKSAWPPALPGESKTATPRLHETDPLTGRKATSSSEKATSRHKHIDSLHKTSRGDI
ncbi:hypothetical protein HPB51_023133 [Rhipicephalus microplus]|uniref:Ig-like domain-containing protein n=1 Tax=Rhipicephalus microplus TaxID=6941 RepID=A0A9J6DJG3_RHIMP|nr:hypothetical protein HPB51_023133 [Rhipicephalus microplus]